ncbi:unnamed protein product [Closterium sp. NIES-54]
MIREAAPCGKRLANVERRTASDDSERLETCGDRVAASGELRITRNHAEGGDPLRATFRVQRCADAGEILHATMCGRWRRTACDVPCATVCGQFRLHAIDCVRKTAANRIRCAEDGDLTRATFRMRRRADAGRHDATMYDKRHATYRSRSSPPCDGVRMMATYRVRSSAYRRSVRMHATMCDERHATYRARPCAEDGDCEAVRFTTRDCVRMMTTYRVLRVRKSATNCVRPSACDVVRMLAHTACDWAQMLATTCLLADPGAAGVLLADPGAAGVLLADPGAAGVLLADPVASEVDGHFAEVNGRGGMTHGRQPLACGCLYPPLLTARSWSSKATLASRVQQSNWEVSFPSPSLLVTLHSFRFVIPCFPHLVLHSIVLHFAFMHVPLIRSAAA